MDTVMTRAPAKSSFSLPFTRLVHENLSIVMTFAFSRRPLEELVQDKFLGEWKYLRKMLFEISTERAEKAAIELAVFLRLLDDEEDISGFLATSGRGFGTLVDKSGKRKPLKFRDVANKIIHASGLEWDFSLENQPILVCHSRDKEKWSRAEISVVALSAMAGNIIS
jgi:hypothetical protein